MYFFFITLCISYAQEENFSIRHFTKDDGLSHNDPTTLFQDSRQFIWIGTRFGLNRFDGHEFKAFSKRKNGLDQNPILDILEDQHEKLWIISFDKLISVFDVENEHAVTFDEYFPNAPFQNKDIHHLKSDKENNIWILKKDGTLFQYDIEFKKVTQHEKLVDVETFMITEEKELLGFNQKYKEIVKINSSGEQVESVSLDAQFVHDIGDFSDEVFWVSLGTPKNLEDRLLAFDWDGNRQTEYFKFKSDSQQWSPKSFFYSDKKQNIHIWHTGINLLLVTNEKGEMIYNFSKLVFQDLNEWFTNEVFIDQSKNVWVTSNKGLILITPKENYFQSFLSQEDSKETILHSSRGIESLDDNHLFVATYLGFYKVNKSTLEIKKINVDLHGQLSPYGVGTFSVGENILCGMHGPNFWIFDKQTLEYDFRILDLKEFQFKFFFKDQFNQIWIGTNKGLLTLDLKSKEVKRPALFSEENDFYGTSIHHIIEDKEHLLVGTELGLYRIDSQGKVLNHFEEIKIYQIKYIHSVNSHQFWLATQGDGIIFWDSTNNEVRQFTKEHGLIDDVIYSIHEDEFGFFWMPSNNGLMRFNPRDFSINAFNERDGLANNEFNTFSHFVDDTGQIYLGGINGITTFHPKDFQSFSEKDIPLKIITSQKLETDSTHFFDIKWDKELNFYPSDKTIALEFCLFDYFNSFQSKYAYQIEGFDDKWNYLNNNRLEINRLPYGNYKINVKAKGTNGVWSNQKLAIPFNVLKPFYLKWYFILISLLGIVTLVYGVIRWRFIQLENKNLILENVVAQRTKELENLNKIKDQFFAIIGHDLRRHVTSFRKVSEKVNFLKQKGRSKELDNYFLRLDRSADSLSYLLDNLLNWALIEKGIFPYHPERIDLKKIIEENIELFRLVSETKEVNIFNKFPDELFCHADKNAVLTIIRNVMSNAIKFSKVGGEIIINSDNNKITIQDFGVGIDSEKLENIFELDTKNYQHGTQSEKGVGLGLRLCNELVKLNKGTISIQSEIGKGTKVVIEFPESI